MTTWLKKTAVLAFIVALPTAVGAKNPDFGTTAPGLSPGIAVEAAKLASAETRRSGQFESAAQHSSNQGQSGRTLSSLRF